MKTGLISFLEKLENWQLAYFYKYRFEEFLPKSKEKILIEFRKRRLQTSDVDSIINNKPTKQSNSELKECSRCGSHYFYEEKEIKFGHVGTHYIKPDRIVNVNVCQVCGYNPYKAPKEEGNSFIKRILDFFIF